MTGIQTIISGILGAPTERQYKEKRQPKGLFKLVSGFILLTTAYALYI